VVSSIVSRGNVLVLGDALRSVTVLHWEEDDGGLKSVARDFSHLWPISLQTLDEENVIGAEVSAIYSLWNSFIYSPR